MPEIIAPNVYAKAYIKRDDKKKTKDIAYKHYNIGFIDESNLHKPELPVNSAEGFSLQN